MTENRVPTTTHADRFRALLMEADVFWPDRHTRIAGTLLAKWLDEALSAQPVPPLDVERLALALDDEGGAFRDRDNRRAAERILVRLGSAATQLPPDEPES